jgi:hypothetical protein
MKTPGQHSQNRPPRPFGEVDHAQGRDIHAGLARQFSQPTTKISDLGEEAYQQDLNDQQKSRQQPPKRYGFLHTRMAREVDCTVHRYTVLEIANEASRGRLSRIAEQAKDLLRHYRQSEFVKQQSRETDRDLDEAPTQDYQAYEATVEQCYRDLNNFHLPKLFLGNRPRWVLWGYFLMLGLTLNCLYLDHVLLPPTLYYSIPITVITGLMVFGLGKHYLWQYTQRELRDMYSQLLAAYDSASFLLSQEAERIAVGLDRDLNRLQRRQARQSQEL